MDMESSQEADSDHYCLIFIEKSKLQEFIPTILQE